MASYTTSNNPAVGAPGPAADACAGDGSQDLAQSFNLRVAAFFIIMLCSAAGVCLPLVARFRPQMTGAVRGGWLFTAKSFGAGVILAVGLIHVFPDASTTLADPCLGAQSRPGTRAHCCRLPRLSLPEAACGRCLARTAGCQGGRAHGNPYPSPHVLGA